VAYLTSTILQDESAWVYTNWQPRFTAAAAFTTWIGTIVTRAASHVEWRVGATAYASATASDLEEAIFKEMELCLAQYYLCLAAGVIADTSDDSEQNPAVGNGADLRGDAHVYKARFDELMDLWGQDRTKRTGPRYRKPRAKAATTDSIAEVIPSFEADVAFEEEN
jgi:hypothetical protein